MFWAKARRTYANVSKDDPDIRTFLALADGFQKDSYKGIVGIVQDAGHRWIAERTAETSGPVLEIGFGAGRHSLFYSGDPKRYFVSEYTATHLETDVWKSVKGRSLRCDARQLPFFGDTFETVISIYNLEHIQNLQEVFEEVFRVLKPKGRFLIALPCEDGLSYNIGRELTTRRLFQKKYKVNYDKVIAHEHVWSFKDIYQQLAETKFVFGRRRFYPTLLPSVNLNLIGCIECIKPAPTGQNR